MKNFAETVRNSADIVRVVSEYVALKGQGSTLKALCPFHSEKTPSFSVHREKQLFHCFGCSVGGDVFKFIMLAEKVSFPESVRIVAEKSGIPIPAFSSADEKRVEEQKQLLTLYERAAAYFRSALSSEPASAARQVLDRRTVSPAFAEKFQLGYAPVSGLLGALKPKDPVGCGLFLRSDRGEIYDRFRHRLMFPIWSERGKTIAFGGRALGDVEPKYLNSPETPLYSKSYVLYASHLARDAAQKAGRLVVVEGYFDCLSLHQAGINNVVASCGTSLTHQQVSLIARYVPEVVMNYDPDAAGRNAMKRSIDLLLAKSLRIRVLNLPGGLDPDDFVRKEGGEVYQRLLASAPHFWQYLVSESMRQYDIGDPSMKAAAVRDVLQSVSKIQDRVERLEVAKAVAEAFRVPEGVIFEQLKITGGRIDVRPLRPAVKPGITRRSLKDSEKQLIHGLLQDRTVGESIRPFLDSEFLKEAWSYPVFAALIANPLSNVEEVLDSVPDEDLKKEVRALVFEPYGRVTAQQALASVAQLYDAHLVKKERDIREKLSRCGPAGPAELVKRLDEIAAEKSRLKALRP
jgi:DNA primase